MELNDIAPCGIDCANCEMNEKSGRTDVWERVAALMKKTVEEIRCKGCREQGGCTIHADCATLACINEKGIDFCYECEEFPCTRLLPAKDGAERLPHNLKVYNLCRIRLLGPEKFLEEATENRKKYFTGKMVIGSGPQV